MKGCNSQKLQLDESLHPDRGGGPRGGGGAEGLRWSFARGRSSFGSLGEIITACLCPLVGCLRIQPVRGLCRV